MRCSAVRLEGALQEINASGSSCGDITGLRIRDTGPSGHVTSALLLSQCAVLYPYINHELRLVIAIEFSELEKALRKRGAITAQDQANVGILCRSPVYDP